MGATNRNCRLFSQPVEQQQIGNQQPKWGCLSNCQSNNSLHNLSTTFMLIKMKKIFAFLLFALFVVTSPIAAQSALKKANKQYELSAFGDAVASYKEVLAKYPDQMEANAKIADCYRYLNDQENAVKHYQIATNYEEIEPIFVFQYGLTLQELGRYDQARQIFLQLAEKAPDFAIRCKQFADACNFANQAQGNAAYKVSNEYVNTTTSDFGPALLGDRVVYASGRNDIRSRNSRSAPAGQKQGSNQLLLTQRDKNGYLDVPVMLHEGFGTNTNDAPAAYTADGKWVAFTRNNFVDGVRFLPSAGMELTLFIAPVDAQGDWSAPAAFPHNGTDFSTGFPCFSPDGKALFFASNRPGGYGGFDLYVSYRVGNGWSSPENLGNTVNSMGDELTPFFDGTSLYFASNYHKGYGGFDIFRAEDSNGRWATIYHTGPGLNSSSDDFGFVFDSARNIGYFVSNRPGGRGAEDLYRIQKETENVVIKVTDALTGAAVPGASLDFSNCGEGAFSTNVNGIFNFQLKENLNCEVVVSKAGFLDKTVQLTTIGLRQNRTLEVSLTNANNAYEGTVSNGDNNRVLEGVKIIATNQSDNEVTTAMTDRAGTYSIALKPNATFVMRYSKAGFRDVSFNFKTGPNDTKAIQNIELLPVGVAAEPITAASTSASPTASQASPLPSTQVKSVTPAQATAGNAQASGFSIQLAAASASNVDLAPYENKLGTMGKVYSVREGGKTKVRLGTFKTREAADEIIQKVRKLSYPSAFIVAENNGPAAPDLVPATMEREVSPRPIEPTPTPIPAASTTNTTTGPDGYLVRLGAYRDVKNFKKDLVEDVGVVEFINQNGYTVVVLSGYDSLTTAQIGLQKAKVRGFPESFLVTFEDGTLKKVN